jgi:hypothetical protein
MQEEVDVSINQAGKKRSIAQIDHFGIRRMLNRGSDFYDALTLKEYFTGLDDLSSLHIEETRCMEDDRMRCRCGGLSNQVHGEQKWTKSDQSPSARGHMGRDGNTLN